MAVPFSAAAGMGLQAGSSILGGFIGSSQKKNEAAIAKYNAAVMRNQADAIRKRTKFLQMRQAGQAARILGEKEAALGGSGLVSSEGAPLLALALQKSELDLESHIIGQEGVLEAAQAENKALEYDMYQKFAKIGARQALVAGFLGAGSAIGGGLLSLPKTTDISNIGTMGFGVKEPGAARTYELFGVK